MVFALQFAVLLICIFIGARMSGIGLGVMGMIGLLIMIFGFGMQPADPPLEVMLIILSVVTSAAALQAAGGMDYLVDIAGNLLKKNPRQITLLGPLVTYLFTLFAGTAHISYSILPIVAEVSTKARIRPERALSMSVTAAHMGITASPVSAASAALLTVLAASGVGLSDILKVCIPATIVGVLVGVLFVMKKGKELADDPEFQEKMKDPEFAAALDGPAGAQGTEIKKGAVKSVIFFALGVATVVAMGSFPEILPDFSGVENFKPGFAVGASGKVQMPSMIMIVMLAVVGLIIMFANTKASDVTKASLFSSGGQATISVFGVVWMSGTFMNHNFALIEGTLGSIVSSYPWLFACALFTLSILLFSQAATAKALMPLGLALGLTPAYLIAIFPSVNGHFFIPGYPTLLTAIQFDRTGTTKIGKYVLNHSFMLPGIVTATAAVIAGLLISSFIN